MATIALRKQNRRLELVYLSVAEGSHAVVH